MFTNWTPYPSWHSMGSYRNQQQRSGGDLDDENQQIKVANNDDLITEILLWLPVKSILRFKSVSKHWLSFISNPQFIHNHYIRNRPSVSGLLLHKSSILSNESSILINPEFEFVPLVDNATRAPFISLTFVNDAAGIKIQQSCNGLLCCCSLRTMEDRKIYYIYNPSTKKYKILPRPSGKNVISISLAFDPLKSPHYKAVSFVSCDASAEKCQIEIYSSETGLWRSSGDPFTASDDGLLRNLPIYWNGAIHWLSTWGTSLYYNVEQECLGMMPMPPIPDGWDERRTRYFGESHGHLHLIEIYGPCTTHFNIFEMENDYSRWFVKYRVNLDATTTAYPEMIRNYLDVSDLNRFAFSILCVVCGKEEEDSFLVLHIPGKVLSYHLKDRSFKKLLEILPKLGDVQSSLYYISGSAYQHIESLSSV
ncbi:hypothetical protein NE237_023989 [Protea cynaroides]|uniref:F-box domain-containing protein n=1 Tax=Protea cynaroides TaxID=273540 RepID=A0A9Q0HE09_9MAGN|nr:hypothetical protein NE237_023989 [Protea cynaroides]